MASKEELKAYLREHLAYELLMLRFTSSRLPTIQHQLEWNECIESFAIHARNLSRFLLNNDTGNCNAKDYVPQLKEANKDKTRPRLLGNHTDKHFFHLAKTRVGSQADKSTLDDVKEAAEWIERHFTAFLSALDQVYRAEWHEATATPMTTVSVTEATHSATNIIQVLSSSTPAQSPFELSYTIYNGGGGNELD